MDEDYKTIITSLRRLENGASNIVEEMKSSKYPNRVDKIKMESSSHFTNSSGSIGIGSYAGTDDFDESHFEVSQSTDNILKRLEGVSSPLKARSGSMEDLRELKGAEPGSKRDRPSISLREQEHLANQLLKDIKSYNSSKQTLMGTELPPHLQAFKDQFEKHEKAVKERSPMKLPIIRQLTPRTKKRISLLPPPSVSEKEAIKKIEDEYTSLDTSAIYNHVQSVAIHALVESQSNHLADPMERLITKKNADLERREAFSSKVDQEEIPIVSTNETLFDKSRKYQKRIVDRSNKMSIMFSPSDKNMSAEQKMYSPNSKQRPDKLMLSPLELSQNSPLKLYLNGRASNVSNDTSIQGNTDASYSPTREVSFNSLNNSPLTDASSPTVSPFKLTQKYPNLGSRSAFKAAQPSVMSPTVSSKLISSSLPSTPLNELDPLGLFSQYSFGNNIDKNKNKAQSNSQSGGDASVDKNVSKHSNCNSDNNSTSNSNSNSSSNSELKIVLKSADLSVIDEINAKKLDKPVSKPIDLLGGAVGDYLPVIMEAERETKEAVNAFLIQEAEIKIDLVRQHKLANEHKSFINHMKISLYDDLGVDVDKQFTKNRVLTNAAKFLLFYVFSQVATDTFTHWRLQAAKLQKLRIKKAGWLLTRVALGLLGRRKVRLIRENKRRQALMEEKLRKKEENRKRWCRWVMTLHLKRWMMGKLKKLRYFRDKTVTRIQKVARGIAGRQRAQIARGVFNFRTCKALAIQCAYRAWLARRTVILRKKLRFVKHYLSELEKRQAARKENMKLSGAASKIMKLVKRYKLKKGMARFFRRLKLKRIVFVQKRIRGFTSRRRFAKEIKVYRAKMVILNDAATKIQCCIRKFLAKTRVHSIRYYKLLDRKQYLNRKAKLLKTPATFLWKLKRHFRYNPTDVRFSFVCAQKIQKMFRGFRVRKNQLRQKINDQLVSAYLKEIRRGGMANVIQRVWRGNRSRKAMRLRRKIKATIIIQCFWRVCSSKKLVGDTRYRNFKTGFIERFIRRFIGWWRYWKMKIYRNKYGKYGAKINRAARRYLNRKKILRWKYKRRQDKEIEQCSAFKTNKLLVMMQLKLVVDCINRPISKFPSTFSKNRCFCNGILQALFVTSSCPGGNTDIIALPTNKATASSLLSFFKRIEGVLDGGTPEFSGVYKGFPKIGFYQSPPPSRGNSRGGSRPSTQEGSKRPKSKGSSVKRKKELQYSLLLDYIRKGQVVLAEITKPLTPTDVDLLFGKAKSEGGSSLDFAEYCNFIALCADDLYKKKEREDNKINEASNDAETTADGSEGSKVLKIPSERMQKVYQKIYYPIPNVKTNLQLSLFLKALVSLWYDPWVAEVLEYIERESRNKLGSYATIIQCVVRKKLAYKVWHIKVKDKTERDARMDVARKVTKFQTLLRRKFAKRRLQHQAQKFLVKYIPFEGKSYWYNPSTRVSQYTKPAILGAYECVTIPMPPVGLEFVVKCSNCTKIAAVKNCNDCEDSFCDACFTALHAKGNRLKHGAYNIPMCGYCKFQMATKNCSSCALSKPKVGSIQGIVDESARGLYCDSCFIYSHHKFEHSLEKRDDLKDAARTLLYKMKDSYLVSHQIRQQLITKHKYDYLVQACEECEWRSVAWRCNDCAQFYCNTCLLGLHSIGGPFCKHVAEKVPFFTPSMNKSYKADTLKQLFHIKMQKYARIKAQIINESRGKMALRIQKFWRRVWYGYIGKQHMKKMRKLRNRAGKLYKFETDTIRNTSEYRLAQLRGDAPVLASDKTRDIVLRKISSRQHNFADHFIMRNQSDWGFYRTSRTDPRKGVPKTGYDVGTIRELIDQATQGGFRMPGRVAPVLGNTCFATSCDLSKFLNPGEMIRIEKQLFKVIKAGSPSMTVVVDRKWRGYKTDPDGYVLYRMPCYASDPYKLLPTLKFTAFNVFVLKNPLVQTYYSLETHTYTALSNIAATMMSKSTRENDLPTALKWRAKSLTWMRKSLVSSAYTSKNFAVAELGTAGNPGEERIKKENEEKALKAAEATRLRNERTVAAGKAIEENLMSKAMSVTEEDIVNMSEEERTTHDKAQAELEKIQAATAASAPDPEPEPEPPSIADERAAQVAVEMAALGKVADSLSSAVSIGEKIQQSTEALSLYQQNKIKHPRKPPKFERPAGTRWYAIREEVEDRRLREEKMTKEELAAEAHEFEECYDPLSEIVFYLHVETQEMLSDLPRQLKAYREIKEDNERNVRNYKEANARIKKIEDLKDRRVLMGGGKKKNY